MPVTHSWLNVKYCLFHSFVNSVAELEIFKFKCLSLIYKIADWSAYGGASNKC